MSSALSACLASIQAHDFLTSAGSFTVPSGLDGLNFYLTFSSTSCAQTTSSDFPVGISFATLGPISAVSATCDALTYADVQDPLGYLYVHCPISTNQLISGFDYSLTIANYAQPPTAYTSFQTSITTTDPLDACIASTNVNLPYLATLGNELALNDQAYLPIYVDYNPLDCTQVSGSSSLNLQIVGPGGVQYSAAYPLQTDLSDVSPTTVVTQTLSTQDFGMPVNGMLPAGTYTITSIGTDSQNQGTFTVSHPLSSSQGPVRRAKMAKKWSEFVDAPAAAAAAAAVAGGAADLSSFFFKGTTGCMHTQCPVPGQVGVFECIDTQTSLDSCGGCPSSGGIACGEDLDGIRDVACVAGKCVVSSCEDGWTLATDKASCFL